MEPLHTGEQLAHPRVQQAWRRAIEAALPPREDRVARNAAITGTYARWYLDHPTFFKWAGMAVFASRLVGVWLKVLTSPRRGVARLLPESLCRKQCELLSETNNEVFDDIAWAHAAYVSDGGGLALVEAGLDGAASHGNLLDGFRAIDRGRAMLREDLDRGRQLIAEGNLALLRHEQLHSVQPRFERFDPRMALFISATATGDFELDGVDAQPRRPRFTPYILRHGRDLLRRRGALRPDIIDFEQRWYWIERDVYSCYLEMEAARDPRLLRRFAELAEPFPLQGLRLATGSSRTREEVASTHRRQAALDDALDRAARWSWSKQRADGSWNAVADLGPACTAQVVVALWWAGALTEDERSEALRFLRGAQQSDGSWAPYPYARSGSAAATASVWAALVACGVARDDEALVRAKRYIDEHGGLGPVTDALVGGEFAGLVLALVGAVPATVVPEVPLAWCLLDPLVDVLHRVVHGGVPFGALQLGVIAKALHGRWGDDHAQRSRLDERAVSRLVAWIDTWQNRDGSVNANTAQTALTLLALRAIGERPGDRRFDLAVCSLRSLAQRDERGLWFGAFESDVWTTALNLRAQLAAGCDPRDPRAVRAVEYLLRCQSDVPQPWINNRRPDAARTGGWAFQRENVSMVDNDDTGMVLAVLGEWCSVDREDDLLRGAVNRAVLRGATFVRSMQNRDGGFSAFVCGLPLRRPGPMMERRVSPPTTLREWARFVTSPPPSLGDPSTEDVTARVLLGLGRNGVESDDRTARESLGFLQRFQQERGSWWGRWVVNYVPATAYVLCGAAAVGVGREHAWVEKAISWVLSLQNEDGGWGEWVDSYVDPSRAGRAASTPPVTALVLAGLVEQGLCGDPSRDEAVDRAADYLVRTQEPHGGWSNRDNLAVFVPPEAFYEYPGANDYAPLDALARYRRRRHSAAR